MNQTNKTLNGNLNTLSGFVYKITNNVNGNWYIGSHRGKVDDDYIASGRHIIKAIEEFGIENFDRIILYIGNDYREKEKEYLIKEDAKNNVKSYNKINISFGGPMHKENNGMYGKHHSLESKRKISKNNIFKNSEFHRKQHSIKMSGKGNPMYGLNRKGTWAIEKGMITKKLKRERYIHLMQGKHHSAPFRNAFIDLAKHGEFSAPREQLIIEKENFDYLLPPYVRFCNFEDRNLNIDYIKEEFLWYLKGDRFDTSITEHASMWKSLAHKDGGINSNYGQYVFGHENQFDTVKGILEDDKDSRRGSILILRQEYVGGNVPDQPCTYALNFRIRKNALNMTVHMRSQDGIFGLGNDAPAFSFIHEMMYNSLKDKYPDIEYGDYFHFTDSFHVYERHFKMLAKIAGVDLIDYQSDNGKTNYEFGDRNGQKQSSYKMVLCPKISGPREVDYIRNLDFTNIPDEFEFAKWLNTKENNNV